MIESTYFLRSPGTDAEWKIYHRIRREVLFEARGRFGIYDDNRPEEHQDGRTPLLLFHQGRPLGTVRLDALPDGSMVTRLVAVDAAEQGRGHGSALLRLAEDRARAAGARRMVVNAANDAEVFYAKSGYHCEAWDDPWAGRPGHETVQMVKEL